MSVEKCKNEIIAHCNKTDMLVEESILKLKLKRADYTKEEVIEGAKLALDYLGSDLEFTISTGKSLYWKIQDKFNRNWLISNALEELENYRNGEITIRGLHYRMVARGMTNSMTHYGRVKSAMVFARRNGDVSYSQFSDYEREVIGKTDYIETDVDEEVVDSFDTIKFWLNHYAKNRWENQVYYPEVWIEKKALIGVFKDVCSNESVLLAPCKGYPSLTFLKDAANRFKSIEDDKKTIILYFGDYDASGEDIPRSIKDNLLADFGVDVEVKRILLLKNQVLEMNLPPAPTKGGDSRGKNWDGLGQVELDSIEPKVIQRYCEEAIRDIFDEDLYDDLMEQEREEKQEYQAKIKKLVQDYEFEE